MSENTALAIFVLGFFVCVIAYWVVLPMFNAYLLYKLDCKQMKDIPNEPIPQLYREVKNEERLQRDNDFPDIKQGSGKSDEGTSLHDEELSL